MPIFTIEHETNNITAHATAANAERLSGAEQFDNEAEFAELAGNWPGERLVEIWNTLPGATPVKKFKDRKTAVARIWKAIQGLVEPTTEANVDAQAPQDAISQDLPRPKATRNKQTPKTAERPPRIKQPTARSEPTRSVRAGSKTEEILALLRKPKGATLAELVEATGWQRHSVRGFLSATVGKKMGLPVESTKQEGGERLYKIAR